MVGCDRWVPIFIVRIDVGGSLTYRSPVVFLDLHRWYQGFRNFDSVKPVDAQSRLINFVRTWWQRLYSFLPVTKKFRKFWLVCKWNTTFGSFQWKIFGRSRGAYHLNGIFGEKFLTDGTGHFLQKKWKTE